MSTTLQAATLAVRAGIDTDTAYGAVVPPIVLSSNFSFAGFNEKRKYDYTRSGNPTRDLLAEALSDLEGGVGAVITATGMAAITVVLALLDPEDTIVVPHDCYGGSWRLFNALAKKNHFKLITADLTDPRALAVALADSPKIVWIETPSNPLLRVTDLRFVAEAAHRVGALVVADNTFLSPALQTPIALGADLVVHSTTKYINGHSDVVGGAVIANTKELHEQLVWWANALGLTGSPFDSFLTLRGLRTLDARLRVHQENATAIAEQLQAHSAVTAVHYPGLLSHPGHALAARQQKGFGAMLSVEIEGGIAGVQAFLDGLECFTLAESLGGVESLVAHPATMTHAAMSLEARTAAGIGDGLLRLSIGIEALEDLQNDLQAALDRVVALQEETDRGIGMSLVNTAANISPLAKQTTLALLGTGTVGSAFLSRLAGLQKNQQAKNLRLVQVSNTRHSIRDFLGLNAGIVSEDLVNHAPSALDQVTRSLGHAGIIIDATASDEVAAWHARWLASGFKVVTANKAATGGNLATYQIINHQVKNYGDAATVGAGLPLLRSLRELRAGGDNIHGIAGILSGSLAWLFNNYDGMRPFSSFVREARSLGYTEPDPRIDLSGQDVKRKLLILARTAGYALEADAIEVESLVPPELANANLQDVDSQLEALDGPLRARFLAAHRIGRRLRFIARLNQAGQARIGLEELAPDDALANGSGCDNRVAIWSDRYPTNALVIQGPGAGAEVTAAALLDDTIRLS